METFTELNLSAPLSRAIAEMGLVKPTPIQARTLPILLKSTATDFLGMAATGTGKTVAFGVPLIERMDTHTRGTQGVVLCPTRELAVQVAGQLQKLGKFKGVEVLTIYGGTGYREQLMGLQRGPQVVVATPGRLLDHLRQGNLPLDLVSTLVLDEADEMISMGFQEDLELILRQLTHPERRLWMFAATMSSELRKVADTYLRNPQVAQGNPAEKLSGTVKQIYFTVREKNKARGLCKILEMEDNFYGLIFCQTKVLVIGLTEYLRVRGYRVDCLHGDKTQFERERTLNLFKNKAVNILVCSDVAARGLDVKELTHVVNYSLPHDFDSYIHRIGRTGRAGQSGVALNLVAPPQTHLIARLEKVTKSKMELGVFPTRKAISTKKLTAFLPKFQEALGFEKAVAVLDTKWNEVLTGMAPTEIAGRFLALAFLELFDDREMADEILPGERFADSERSKRRDQPQRRQQSRRPFSSRKERKGHSSSGPRRHRASRSEVTRSP